MSVYDFDPSLPFGPAGESGSSTPRSNYAFNPAQWDAQKSYRVEGGTVYRRSLFSGPSIFVPDHDTSKAYPVETYATGHTGSHDRPEVAYYVTEGPMAGHSFGKRLIGNNPFENLATLPMRIVQAPFTKEFWEGVGEAFSDWPGLFGFTIGAFMPWLPISPWFKLGFGITTAVGGYYSDEGSWFRNFSIGAGIGGMASAGYYAYENWPTLGEAALAVGEGAWSVAKNVWYDFFSFGRVGYGLWSYLLGVDTATVSLSAQIYLTAGSLVPVVPWIFGNDADEQDLSGLGL